jgi:alcohol dehydrogenase
VALRYADRNLVRVPDQVNSATAALLGCRFATAYRGVVDQGRVVSGEWVAVHGCGGVGLAAIMIARACGAQVVAIDPDPGAQAFAGWLGADVVIDPADTKGLSNTIHEATGGGPHLSIEAAGDPAAVAASVASLRPRGRHVQIGLLPANETTVPMSVVIGRELEILGSHGMQAHRYPEMLEMILDGRLKPEDLVTRTIPLSEIPEALRGMGEAHEPGVTVVGRMDS